VSGTNTPAYFALRQQRKKSFITSAPGNTSPHPTPLTEALEAAAPLFYNYYDYELWTDTFGAAVLRGFPSLDKREGWLLCAFVTHGHPI
jgi:hypothetical protein